VAVGPTRLQRVVSAVAGPMAVAIQRLPDRVLRRLAGPRPEIERQRLSPGLALICRLSTPIVDHALADPSPRWRFGIDLFAGSMTHGTAKVEARDVEMPGIGFGARLYDPDPGTDGPLVLYFHGGGFCFSSVAGHEGTCAFLSAETGARILSVNFPLAPEHPSPAAHDAATAIWRWVIESADALGTRPEAIWVGGDSAGGNLAAWIGYGETGLPRPAGGFMLYPVADVFAEDPSTESFAEGLLLTGRGLANISSNYVPDGKRDGPHAICFAPVPADAPPCFIGVAGMDPLRDQGVRLARHLEQGGAEVELAVYDDVIHGYATLLVVPDCMAATRDAAGRIRRLLSRAPLGATGAESPAVGA
jgi:acetyl esterase/lipase